MRLYPYGKSLRLGIIIVGLAGCVTVRVEPLLPFPDPPALSFTTCQPATVCLTDVDGDKLSKWMQKVEAYQDAIRRLSR